MQIIKRLKLITIVVPASQVAQPIFVKQHLNSVPVHCRTILLDKYGIMMIMIMVYDGSDYDDYDAGDDEDPRVRAFACP